MATTTSNALCIIHTKKLFSYSELRQHWTCSHEGLLHYWFNPLHWCDHFTDRHTIFRDQNNVYKNVSTLWYTGSTNVLHFHTNSKYNSWNILYFATFLSTYTNAPKKKRFETSIKSNMGMHVMCQIRYYSWMLLIGYWK